MFMTVVLKNPLRTKQLQQGLMQLGEEGAIQVFKPDAGGNMLLGAVGQLQFEVVQHRLKTEYDCDVRLEGCQYTGARWITADTPAELREFENAYPLRMAHDAADTLAYLCTSPMTCAWRRSAFPRSTSIRCASMRGWRCRRPDEPACNLWISGPAARRDWWACSPTSTTRSPPRAPSRPTRCRRWQT
jgi:peptide subunit release factor RF-3